MSTKAAAGFPVLKLKDEQLLQEVTESPIGATLEAFAVVAEHFNLEYVFDALNVYCPAADLVTLVTALPI